MSHEGEETISRRHQSRVRLRANLNMSSGRQLLRSLCEPYVELLDKAESYLAMVDLWASRGNAATLASAVGAGKHAVVAGLAAKR